MNLLIDWGNTHFKYLLMNDIRQGKLNESDIRTCDSSSQLLADLPQTLDNILISSVRTDAENSELEKSLASRSQSIFFATTSSEDCGIQCAYKDFQCLGVDRWLGIIAAKQELSTQEQQENAAIGVIDIGSAITIDLVSATQHLGGQITPGLKLQHQSLKQTGRVRPGDVSAELRHFGLGKSTADCVESGILSMIESYLTLAISEISKQHKVCRWIVCGGGGEFWHSKLSLSGTNVVHAPLLVLEGLRLLYLSKTLRN